MYTYMPSGVLTKKSWELLPRFLMLVTRYVVIDINNKHMLTTAFKYLHLTVHERPSLEFSKPENA